MSRAIEPVSPSFPKKLPIILVATAAAFFLSFALIASRVLLGGKVDAEPATGRRAARAPAPEAVQPRRKRPRVREPEPAPKTGPASGGRAQGRCARSGRCAESGHLAGAQRASQAC